VIPGVKAVKLQRFKTRHKPPFAQREDVTRLNLDMPNEMEVGTDKASLWPFHSLKTEIV
jgi:hypothetical protein